MSLATLCRPSGRYESLKPGERCANCGMTYQAEQNLKQFIEQIRTEKKGEK